MKPYYLLFLFLILSFEGVPQSSVEKMIFRSLDETKSYDPKEIRTLYLENQVFTTIPDSVFLFKNLTKLSLNKNKIKTIPAEIAQLTQLSWLELRDNEIDSIHPDISQLTRLERLNLYHNNLEMLPETMKDMDSLEVLNISRNPLSGEGLLFVFELVQLKELNISKLRLKKLPPEIGNMINLEFLSIFCNQIDSLPSSIGNLRKMEVFNGGNNPRIFVSPEFSKLKNMRRMYWVGNRWKNLPEAFENMNFVNDFYLNGHEFSDNEKKRVNQLFPASRLNLDK